MAREKRTVRAMIGIYCRAHHGRIKGLCEDCGQLFEHAMKRLDRCPFAGAKPTCAKCPVRCYELSKRAKIREVMRFAGPRMLSRHPILAIRHSIDGRKAAPEFNRGD